MFRFMTPSCSWSSPKGWFLICNGLFCSASLDLFRVGQWTSAHRDDSATPLEISATKPIYVPAFSLCFLLYLTFLQLPLAVTPFLSVISHRYLQRKSIFSTISSASRRIPPNIFEDVLFSIYFVHSLLSEDGATWLHDHISNRIWM